jgi:FkbM family methyltransferase
MIQNLVPEAILTVYKKNKYVKILKNHSVENEPDLKIARLLVNKNSTVVDIGSNIGLYAKYLSPLSKEVICIEPIPFTFEMLNHTVQKFDLANVETHKLAISETSGSAEILIPIQAGVQNYYRASVEPEESHQIGLTINVITKTLDDFLERVSVPISLIKCDVEGHELSVLEGAEKVLKAGLAAWLIEVSGNPDDTKSRASEVLNLMQSYGFQVFWFDGNSLNERKTNDKSVNYFFLKERHIKHLTDKGIQFISE